MVKLLAIFLAMLDNEEEQEIMTAIYNAHKPVMLRYALSITKNMEIAEDAVHDAMLSIITHKEKYFHLPSKELRAVVTIMTRNKCIDLLRKTNNVAHKQIDEMEYVLIANDASMDKHVILMDDYRELKKHMASLDKVSRLVLEMKYFLNMTYKDIGNELGMTDKHVETKIMRTKEKLRKLTLRGGELVD